MGAQELSVFSMLFLFILVVPVVIVEKHFKLNLKKRLLTSVFRMTIQLSIVGIYLQYIFKLNNKYLNIFYVILMISVASFSVVRGSELSMKHLLPPVFLSIVIPHTIMLLYFNAFVIRLDNIFDAKYLITIGGMLLGNCLKGNIISLASFYQNLREEESTYLYTIALGANRFQAVLPYFAKGVTAALNPNLAAMATIGLVSLPGMMTGQILGGSIPLLAIKYQLAIMLAIFITTFFSAIMAIFFSFSTAFDDFDMLKKDIFVL